MLMEISFRGGAAVDADFKGHLVHTDQPEKAGGLDSGPSPFDLFLASLGTCAGYYVARFCELKGIDPKEVGVALETIRDPARKRVARIRIEIDLPPDFPEKYRKPLIRAADQCTVKRHLLDPPEIETAIV